MRFSTISAIATFAAAALAQDLSSLPSCGTTCVGNGLSSTGCNQIDISCICKSSSWISDLSCCVSKACDPADQQTIITFAQQICSPVGVTNLPTVAACTGSAAATGSVTTTASSGTATSGSTGATTTVGGSSTTKGSSSGSSAAAATGAANMNGEHLGLGMGIAAAAGLFAAAL